MSYRTANIFFKNKEKKQPVYFKRFYELHEEKLKAFRIQNPSTGNFDVIFQIKGRKLYAHKSKLCDVSNTFEVMLSERWTSPNQPIKLETYSFDDFKEFITFIYSGDCKLTRDNIYAMVDIAEFYNVKVFKNTCEEFLLNNRPYDDNPDYYEPPIGQYEYWKLEREYKYSMLELGYKYSMIELKKSVLRYVSRNLMFFIKNERFQGLQKSIIIDIVQSNKNTVRQEELFEMVYKWAENQALKQYELDKNISCEELIKEKLFCVQKFFNFNLMNNEFLLEFVVKKTFLFSGIELSNILLSARYLIRIVDHQGRMMKGVLNCHDIDKVFRIIQSNKNIPCRSSEHGKNAWKLMQPIKPSEPSKITDPVKEKRYLVCTDWYKKQETNFFTYVFGPSSISNDPVHSLSVKHFTELKENDYLLAEMNAEDGFDLCNSKII